MKTKEIRLPLHPGQTMSGMTSTRGLYNPGVLGREQPDGERPRLRLQMDLKKSHVTRDNTVAFE